MFGCAKVFPMSTDTAITGGKSREQCRARGTTKIHTVLFQEVLRN